MNLVFSLLAKIRNPNLFKIYNYQKLLEKSDDIIIENIKKSKLRSLLIHANENTKFWNSKFINENINPYSKYPFEELKKIIPITKDDLINNNEFIQNFIKGEKHFKASTSGTSGKKLVFLKNEKWDSANRASIFQGYSWSNCSPNNFKIYFWGLNLNFITKVKTRFLDLLQNRYRIFSYDLKDFDKVASKKDKIDIIEGYSSSIYEFSKYVIKHKIIFPNLKMVKATSETIQDEYIISVKKAFGLNLTSEYGSAEAGIISFSCEKGNMHVNELNVIVEESSKEIIVTNLNSLSFPIIKYIQGDYIDYNTKKICSCGLKSKVINKVYGRVGAIIQGHKSYYGSLLLYNVFKNINLKNKLSLAYHAKQFEKGKIEIYIDRTQLNKRNIDLICKEFKLYCDRDLDIILKEQKTKPKTKKLKILNPIYNDLVSIIMPTYNSENYISESIKSVINQSYENWELLITDDFSTDKTIKVVQDFQKQDDRIILFHSKINKGAGIARNNSISNAKGRFIAFLDSDDRWKPNKLKTQIAFMLSNKLSLTYSGYDVINEKGSYIKTIIAPESINYSEILSNNYIGCLTAIYDTNSIGKKYMPDIRRRQDWVLWINILELIREAKGITDSLAIYVDRKGSISGNKLLMLKYNWTVYSNILGFNKVKSFLLMINFILHYAIKKIK